MLLWFGVPWGKQSLKSLTKGISMLNLLKNQWVKTLSWYQQWPGAIGFCLLWNPFFFAFLCLIFYFFKAAVHQAPINDQDASLTSLHDISTKQNCKICQILQKKQPKYVKLAENAIICQISQKLQNMLKNILYVIDIFSRSLLMTFSNHEYSSVCMLYFTVDIEAGEVSRCASQRPELHANARLVKPYARILCFFGHAKWLHCASMYAFWQICQPFYQQTANMQVG